MKYCSNVQFVLFWSMNPDVQWEDRWKPYVVLICDPKHVRFSSMFSLGIKTHAHNEISHFLLSFRNNFTPNVQFVFSFLNFTGNVSLFGPSVSVIHPDFLWCLANEFFKLFINRTNLQKCSSGSKTLKILTD